MNEFRADLHCHSIYSDGSDTPEELVCLAAEKGLKGLSITDHDTTRAYPEVFDIAKAHGISMVPGVEFSTMHRGTPVHILAYAFSLENPSLQALCHFHTERRHQRNHKILERLRGLGIEIDEEVLQAQKDKKTIGRPHIAHALMEKGVVSSVREAFDRYLGEGKPAYDPGEAVSVEKTLEVIREAQGLAVIAHPHLIRRRNIVRQLLEFPFDGIEGYYARMPLTSEQEWLDRGSERGWIITGGSDYHGSTKPESILGSSWVDEATFNTIYRHYEQLSR